MKKENKVNYPEIPPSLTTLGVIAKGTPYLVAIGLIAFGFSIFDFGRYNLTDYTYSGEYANGNGAFGGALALIGMGLLSLAFLFRTDFGKPK